VSDAPISLTQALDLLREDSSTLCLQVHCPRYAAVFWFDSAREEYVGNFRFGSGQHHTLANPDRDRMKDQFSGAIESEDGGAWLVFQDRSVQVRTEGGSE